MEVYLLFGVGFIIIFVVLLGLLIQIKNLLAHKISEIPIKKLEERIIVLEEEMAKWKQGKNKENKSSNQDKKDG